MRRLLFAISSIFGQKYVVCFVRRHAQEMIIKFFSKNNLADFDLIYMFLQHAIRVADSFTSAKVPAKFLRLNICGAPASGKTTLKENLNMNFFKRLFKSHATDGYTPTRGIDLSDMTPGMPWSRGSYRMFDMAGQDEFLPSHAFSLGHPHSVYLLVVNLSDDQHEDQAKHWLSSISSCHNHQKQKRPPVVMVASHADQVPCELSRNGLKTNRKAAILLRKLQVEYSERFNFIGDPIVMDCRLTSSAEVKHLKTVLTSVLEETLPVSSTINWSRPTRL